MLLLRIELGKQESAYVEVPSAVHYVAVASPERCEETTVGKPVQAKQKITTFEAGRKE